MSWWKDFRFLWLMAIAILFFAAPAWAQFEVSPDHFDTAGKLGNTLAANRGGAVAKPRNPNVAQGTVVAAAGFHQGLNTGQSTPRSGSMHPKLSRARRAKADRSPSRSRRRKQELQVAESSSSIRKRE